MLQVTEEPLCKRPRNEDSPSTSSAPPADAAPPASQPQLAERGLGVLADNGDTALHAAASGGHLEAVTALLGAGAQADVAGHRLRTPLHCAVAHGHLAVARRLLDAGADVDAKDEDDATALELAAGNGHTQVARFLLEKGSQADVKLATSAISQGNEALLELFLEKGVSVDARSVGGDPLLVQAAKAKRWEIVQYLLGKGACATHCRSAAECALVLASVAGEADAVRRVLRGGAASDAEQVKAALQRAKSAAVVWALMDDVPRVASGDVGRCGLLFAARDGRVEPLMALLEAGVSANATIYDNCSALHLSALHGHVDCARELLRRGADANARDAARGTPLHKACARGHAEVVRALLDRGSQVNAKDRCGWMPLHAACYWDRAECVRELVDRGADVNAEDENGWTPLHRASSRGHAQVVRELLERGAGVNARDVYGWTPLHRASYGDRVLCVRELLLKGAEVTARDNAGKTPIHTAFGHWECFEALMKRVAKVNTPLHSAYTEEIFEIVRELMRMKCRK